MSIIHLAGITSPPKWDQIAAMMGDGFTAESTRQHFQKMRKETNLGSAPPAPSAITGTPRKRGKVANGEILSKSGTKRKTKPTGDDDEEAEGASPTKKQAIKTEHVVGGGDDTRS